MRARKAHKSEKHLPRHGGLLNHRALLNVLSKQVTNCTIPLPRDRAEQQVNRHLRRVCPSRSFPCQLDHVGEAPGVRRSLGNRSPRLHPRKCLKLRNECGNIHGETGEEEVARVGLGQGPCGKKDVLYAYVVVRGGFRSRRGGFEERLQIAT